jgi:archaellum component FlaG (FlaF/FlaG flagellin family)
MVSEASGILTGAFVFIISVVLITAKIAGIMQRTQRELFNY